MRLRALEYSGILYIVSYNFSMIMSDEQFQVQVLSSLSELKTDVKEVKKDVKDLQGNVKDLYSHVDGLYSHVDKLYVHVDGLYGHVDKLYVHVDGLYSHTEELSHRGTAKSSELTHLRQWVSSIASDVEFLNKKAA